MMALLVTFLGAFNHYSVLRHLIAPQELRLIIMIIVTINSRRSHTSDTRGATVSPAYSRPLNDPSNQFAAV